MNCKLLDHPEYQYSFQKGGAEKLFISSSFPDEYAGSKSRIALKGAVAKAKANAAQGIPELIQIAANEDK